MLKPGLIDLPVCGAWASHFLELINMDMKFQIPSLKAYIENGV